MKNNPEVFCGKNVACSLITTRVSPSIYAPNIFILSFHFATPRSEQLGNGCKWEEFRTTSFQQGANVIRLS